MTLEQEADLLVGPAPVLGREGVDGEPLDAQLDRPFGRVQQRFLAGPVALGAGQAPSWWPTARCRP